ncbi:MAG: right-handed parallel beta-helix repeat-containing protein, partial [Candidatus Hodarchaeales archaeon]
MRKIDFIAIMGILILSTLFCNPQISSKSNSEIQNNLLSENFKRNSLNSVKPPIKQRVEGILYDTAVNWTNQYIKINESLIFSSSTSLTINNSIIEFLPINSTQFIDFQIDANSELIIHNSIIYQNYSSAGHSSIYMFGGYLDIKNSTFSNLGINHDYPGIYVTNIWHLNITESTFIDSYRGIVIENSVDINIIDCTFKDFFMTNAVGIMGDDLARVKIINSTFENFQESVSGVSMRDIVNLTMTNCTFRDYGDFGLIMYPSDWNTIVENITVEQNTFINGTFGSYINGFNVSVQNNVFGNIIYSGLLLLGDVVTARNNFFENMSIGVEYPFMAWWLSAITQTTIQNNTFNNIFNYAIYLSNYDGVTVFYYLDNRITNVGTAFGFVGNLGGESEANRAQISGNIIENVTYYAITGISWDYLARLQHITISRNAFINCSLGYTSFQEDYYYLIDIHWDDGL